MNKMDICYIVCEIICGILNVFVLFAYPIGVAILLKAIVDHVIVKGFYLEIIFIIFYLAIIIIQDLLEKYYGREFHKKWKNG